MDPTCDLVLPCRDEGRALEGLLPRVPAAVARDRRRQRLARRHRRGGRPARRPRGDGARARVRRRRARGRGGVGRGVPRGDGRRRVVRPGRPGPAARRLVRSGRADMAVGRRRPVSRGVWPWHARVGNALVVRLLRRRIGLAVHDIAPMRVCRRQALLDLDVQDRRFGYPVELLAQGDRRAAGGSSSATSPTTRARRAPAPRCPARSAAPRAPPATSPGCCRDHAVAASLPQDPRRPGWCSPRPRSPAG